MDTSGGKSLGPRLLLPLLPLLSVSAIVTIASYLRSPARVDRAVGWVGVALVVTAVAIHLGGTIPAYRQRNADDALAIRAAASSSERVVVADDMFTAQLLFPLYHRKIVFLADTIESGTAWAHSWRNGGPARSSCRAILDRRLRCLHSGLSGQRCEGEWCCRCGGGDTPVPVPLPLAFVVN